jgi:hypothetical protein
MVVFAVFQENVAVDLQLSQSERAKNRAASKRPSQICTVLQVLMTKKYRDRLRRIFSPLFRFWGVPFNKRVLSEEEQTVATHLEKSKFGGARTTRGRFFSLVTPKSSGSA